MPTFADELKAARKKGHITQEQLAKAMNVSRSAISHWENGNAIPDIETIKRLSQVMNYNFFTLSGLADAAPSEEASAEETPTEEASAEEAPAAQEGSAVRKPRREWVYAAGGLCLVLLCLLLFNGIAKGLSKAKKAEIVVTPSTEVAYLVPFGDDADDEHYGWTVDFAFENRSDVPFTPEKIVGYYYTGDELFIALTASYEDFQPWMGNDKLLKSNSPLRLPFGSDWLFLTHCTVTIYGVDDNGHSIEASATVQYSQEHADQVEGQ